MKMNTCGTFQDKFPSTYIYMTHRKGTTWLLKSHLPNKNNNLFYKCKPGIYCWSLVHIWINITKYCSAQSMFLWDNREHYLYHLNDVLVFTTVLYTDKLISGISSSLLSLSLKAHQCVIHLTPLKKYYGSLSEEN